MKNNKYTYELFKESMPEKKRRKDPFLTRIFYRPLAFWCASRCARMGISANTVSYWSCFVAIIACTCFLFNEYVMNIIGAILINVWILMDCIDGNIARTVKKQHFGAFADASSSYLLVGLMGVCVGMAAYFDNGVFVKRGCPWIIFIGALAGSSDSLMRLVYQKYKNVEHEMADKGIIKIEDEHLDDPDNWKTKINEGFGIGGIMPAAILVCAFFHALDIFVIYSFIYFGGSFFLSFIMIVRKAIRKAKENADAII